MSLNLRHKIRLTPLEKNSLRGLTLVEILVVIAIFSILATMLFTVFRGGIDAWRKMETHLDMYQNARAALEQMSREISSALLDQTSSDDTKWASFYGKDEKGTKIETDSAKDEIFFVTPVENVGDMDLCEIGYWLKKKDNGNVLMRHFQNFDAPEDLPIKYLFTDADSEDEFIANVKDLQFKYYYRSSSGAAPTATTDSWDSTENNVTNYDLKGVDKNPDGLPEAVEITLTVQSKDGKESRSFTTLVKVETAR